MKMLPVLNKMFTQPLFAMLSCSALLVFSAPVWSQAPIVDSSSPVTSTAATESEDTPADNQGELFYQIQLLQQEVMQLRGMVEEQANTINKLKEQGMERYIDLDKRIGQLASKPAPAPAPAKPLIDLSPKVDTPVVPETAAQPGEKQVYDQAYSLVATRQFDAALAAFQQYLQDYPDGKYAPNSYYWIGELFQVVTPQNLEQARQSFTQLLDQYPNHAKVPDALYKLGKVYFLKGNREKSRQLLEQVIAEYGPGSEKRSSSAEKAKQFLRTNL